MKRLRKLAKKTIQESTELIFDQTGLDFTSLATEPVKTLAGKSVVTDTQLKAICASSRPMNGSKDRLALTKDQMAGLPDSLLDTGADKTVTNSSQEENIYLEMSKTQTKSTIEAAAAETIVSVADGEVKDVEKAEEKTPSHPALQMHEDVGGRNAAGAIYFRTYANQLAWVDAKYIKLPATVDEWDNLSGEKWDCVMFALGMKSEEEIYENPDLCIQEEEKDQNVSPSSPSIVHSTPVGSGARCKSFKGTNLSKVVHNRGVVDQTYTESRGKTAFLDKAKVHQLSPAPSKCGSLEWDNMTTEMHPAAATLSINRPGAPMGIDMSHSLVRSSMQQVNLYRRGLTKDSGLNSLQADGAGTARTTRMQNLLEMTLQLIDRIDICNANPINHILDKTAYLKIVPLMKEIESMQIIKSDGQLGQQCIREATKLNECYMTYIQAKHIVQGPLFQLESSRSRGEGTTHNRSGRRGGTRRGSGRRRRGDSPGRQRQPPDYEPPGPDDSGSSDDGSDDSGENNNNNAGAGNNAAAGNNAGREGQGAPNPWDILNRITLTDQHRERNQAELNRILGQAVGGRTNGNHLATSDYLQALKSIRYFSGQPINNLDGVPPAARNFIEERVEIWVASYEQLVISWDMDETQQRSVFFDRLCGAAFEALRPYRHTEQSIEELIALLSMRFLSLRTYKEICTEIENLQRLPGETIVLFVGRLEHLAFEYQRLAPGGGSDAVRIELVYNTFIRKVCCSRTAQRLEDLGIDGRSMPLAIKAAQDFCNRHEIEPWCRSFVEK